MSGWQSPRPHSRTSQSAICGSYPWDTAILFVKPWLYILDFAGKKLFPYNGTAFLRRGNAPYITVYWAWHTEYNKPIMPTSRKAKAPKRMFPIPLQLVEYLKAVKTTDLYDCRLGRWLALRNTVDAALEAYHRAQNKRAHILPVRQRAEDQTHCSI